MPPDLPPSVLAALGLAMVGCTGKACLMMVGTAQACLMIAPTETAETGDTGAPETTPAASTAAALLERLAAEDVLPADVVERLRTR